MTAAKPAPAFGVVVPPANPTVEPELRALAPSCVDYYVTRLPVLPGTLRDRTAAYLQHIPDSLRAFGDLQLDAVYVACTGCYYLMDDGTAAGVAGACAAARTVPVVTPTDAIREAAELLGVSSMALVSPYPEWLTAACTTHWRSVGLEVVDVVGAGAGSPYGISTADVLTAVARLSRTADLLLFTGTGMVTVPAMRALRERDDIAVPMLSSNLAGVWQVLRDLGRLDDATALRRLAPDLVTASTG